jgi:hypothetical protein
MSNTNFNINFILVEVKLIKLSYLRSQSMYEYKLRGEHMTRVRCKFFLCPKKWTNCQNKKRVDSLRTRVLGLVVAVNSRDVLEGKK